MDPASPQPATIRTRNAAVAGLGVLAVVSLAGAIVAVNLAGLPAAAGTRSASHLFGGPKKSVSESPTIPTASPVAGATSARPGTGAQPEATSDSGTTGTAASVVYFRLRQPPACGPGKAVPAIVEWKVAAADGAALSVDNPGLVGSYRSYSGRTGQETLTFSCGGPPGSTEQHVYILYTVGGGERRSATLTATARIAGASPTPTVPPDPSPSTSSSY
jgi:hypothetical protein